MKKLMIPLIIAASISAFAFASNASAAEGKSMTPQQQKFAECAHQSKGLKGDEHKKFMSDCLAGKTHEMKVGPKGEDMDAANAKNAEKPMAEHTKMMTSREKMKACSTEAKSKKLNGNDRKAFMKECLKRGGK
jgi:hypothetical protein